MNEGVKHDQGKQPFYAMPLEVLMPLADVFAAGEKKYATFNCLQPFSEPDRRFWDGMMRHAEKCQLDPLAIDEETGCYHAAQIAFNTLMRLFHCKKLAGLQDELDREYEANCELDLAARELKKAMLAQIADNLREELRDGY